MMRHDKVGQDDHCYLIDRNCNPMMVVVNIYLLVIQ